MSKNIIIPPVPDTEDLLVENKIAPIWQRWFTQLREFLIDFFPIFMVDSPVGKVSRVVFRASSMTQVDRDAITHPQNGMIIFNETSGKINYYQEATWKELP